MDAGRSLYATFRGRADLARRLARLAVAVSVCVGAPEVLAQRSDRALAGALLTPDRGGQGETVTIALESPDGRFIPGETFAKFGDGMAVGGADEGEFGPVTVLSPTRARIELTIAADADADEHLVVVKTRGDRVAVSDRFRVLARRAVDPPTFTIEPDAAPAGASLTVTIHGSRTHFRRGQTRASFGDDITVGSRGEDGWGAVTVVSDTEARAAIAIGRRADVGPRTVRIDTGGERLSRRDAFAVLPASPQLTIAPDSGAVGQSLVVEIDAPGAHFEAGDTEARFGAGVLVGGEECFGPVTVLGPTRARVPVQIESRAAVGVRDVTVRTRHERLFARAAFRVVASRPVPTITSVTPGSGRQGQTIAVAIVGSNTNFATAATQVDAGAGVLVRNVTVSSPTALAAEFVIDPAADPGARNVTVTTGTETAVGANAFVVQPGIPTLTIDPPAAQQGQTVPFAVTGQFTHFVQDTTRVDLGPGVQPSSIVVTSATALAGQLIVAPDAPLGSRTLTVTTGAESAALAGAFTINAGNPTLTLAEPPTSQQGQTLTVVVTGAFTHFAAGTTVDVGAGATVDRVDVTSPTSLSAHVVVDRFAIPGARTVAVTSGAEVVSASLFAVAAGPTITAAVDRSPNDAGWYNADVTVTFACDDGVSAVASCTPPIVVATEGANQVITGTVVNAAGIKATTSVTLSIDKTPPVVTFVAPTGSAALFTPDVTATFTTSDALSGVVGAACGGVPLGGGADLDCAATLTPGANAITATATDAAGNTGSATLSLTYARPPLVHITSPDNLAYLSLTPTTVTGTVDDPTASVVVNGLTAPVSNGQFTIALPIAEGPTVIAAAATSASGATGTASITVTLDTTAPHVSITSPPDHFQTTDDAIAVAGIVNDTVVGTVNDQQAQVSVNGQPAQVGNRTFLRTNVALAVGDNVIEAVGRDRVGNTASARITVTRVPPADAHIRTVSGNHQTGAIGSSLAAPLVVELVDATGAPAANTRVIFKVLQDDGLVSAGAGPAPTVVATTDAQGRAQAQWTLGHRAGAGSDTVQAYAVGFAGTAIFDATATQGPPGKIVVDTGNDQIGAVGQPLPKPLIAVVVDEGNNRLADVPVTFEVREGGGTFSGQSTVTVITDSDGRAAATLTLGLQEGNDNNIVAASFPGNDSFPAGFHASARVPGNPANTTISGIVLDNDDVPIAGVTLRAVLTSQLNSNRGIIPSLPAVQTDANGHFSIAQAPVGYVKLLVDGLTAQREGVYPALEYDMVTVAGQDNTVTQPIYLLPLNTANQLCVTPTTGGGTLTIPEAPGFSLTINPGQVTFPGGTQTGCVTVTVVHGDKVPMVPGFGQQPRFIVTIQPSGAVFNPPAAITLPNVDGLAPRAVTEMYSFDHDIGSFVAIGTGTVSDDGLIIRSNPGVGVLKSGWHCGGNPNSTGTAATCPTCTACDGTSCVPAPGGGTCDDGKFCTQNDTCQNGTCVSGPRIPDVPGDQNTIAVDLDKVMDPVRGFLRTLFGLGAPDLSLAISVKLQDTLHCCDLSKSLVNNVVITGTATVGISTGDIPIPGLAVSLPFNITAGLFASVTLSATGSLTGTNDKCTSSFVGSLGGGITLSGSVKAQLTLPAGIASASASGTMGVSCNFSGPIQPDFIPCTGSCGNNGITMKVSATFANGLIKTDSNFVVLPPDRLGNIDFFLPSPM